MNQSSTTHKRGVLFGFFVTALALFAFGFWYEDRHGSKEFMKERAQCLDKTIEQRLDYAERWIVDERVANFLFCTQGLIRKHTGTKLTLNEYFGDGDSMWYSSDFREPPIIPPDYSE